MNTRSQFNARTEERHEFSKLKTTYGEDPARFLQSGKELALARIAGIRDEELLEAYRAVAKQILSGSSQTEVIEALDTREHELTDKRTTNPIAATDGGTVETPDDSVNPPQSPSTTAELGETTPSPTPDSASDSDSLHPDVKGLEAGEVLVLERDESTEYIFPALPKADDPYLCRMFDAEGDKRTAEPMGMSLDEVLARLDGSPDPTPIGKIDVRPPTNTVTNGGDFV